MLYPYSDQTAYFLNQAIMQSNQFNQSTDMSSMHQPKEQQIYVDLTETKRKQSLERNRLAAYRCREKKKNEQQQMVEQAECLEARNKMLHAAVNKLKNEVVTLRELLLAHDVCDCKGIHSFIQKSSNHLQ